MTINLRSLRVVGFSAALLFCRPAVAGEKPIDYCQDAAKKVLLDPTILDSNVINIVNSASCFFQASLSNRTANEAIAPVRTMLWNTFESVSPSQQQGSSLSSSGSTNTVSKPTGPTSLVEEFGGANVTRGTSSSTVQWSPGTMLTNLALTGADYLCLSKNQPAPCVSARLLRNLSPLTFKLTGNTSSGTPTTSGTAATATSTAAAQQVTVNSKGNSGPNFAGLTVQYSLLGSRDKAAVKSLTSQVKSPGKVATPSATQSSAAKYFGSELHSLWEASHDLDNCTAYKNWVVPATEDLQAAVGTASVPHPTAGQLAQVQGLIESEYGKLLAGMLSSEDCHPALKGFQGLYAAILEEKTYEDFVAAQSSSVKPELAVEYDLNTPQSKPTYSSVKATFNWQFGKGTPSVPSAPSGKDASPKLTSAQQSIHTFASNEAAKLAPANPGKASATGKPASANAKALAHDNAQPWSLTLTGTADIYNVEPPSSVPSGSHLKDIQAGAELAYVFSPSSKKSALWNLLGSVTAAAGYSYQDQTSPSILTGPVLTTFTGLPSSTATAYAQRGIIHLGQVRLGFGTGKNLTFPLAFTYSNRTELIIHPTWGLQFGISYSLTSLFSSAGGNKSGNPSGSD
jgi:hypothetical protein